jgi:hypothetical protein
MSRAVPNIPPQLQALCSSEELEDLLWALRMNAEELERAYASAVSDHNEAEGDDALLFGNAVRVRHRYRALLRCEERPGVFGEETSWRVHRIRVGRFRIKSYKLGEFIDDDIYRCVPGWVGGDGLGRPGQIPLFTIAPEPPLEMGDAMGINELIYGHFGNPREGLVKHYLGALDVDARGRRRWAWVLRQDERPESAVAGVDMPRPIVPFDKREAASFKVKPKRAPTGDPERVEGKG